MNSNKLKEICENLIDTFLFAGNKSIELRNIGLIKTIKPDNTPVTNADIEVNDIITKKITVITPDIPIVSEESESNKLNKNMNEFWLIDPIDGTNDYVSNKDEFTLNAALIINKKPELGIVYAPAKKRLFYSYGIGNSFELSQEKKSSLTCEKKTKQNQIKAVTYSESLIPIIKDFHKKNGVTGFAKMKSSLKFCVIASGEYDLYVAEPRASEWDIAAGHAIVKNAGGIVTDFDGKEIEYGKKDFKNTSLIIKRSADL